MAKSKFFGYVLRNAGTPCQQWVLNELPVSTFTAFTSLTTVEVPVGGVIPLSSVTINQFGGRINSDGSFSLPCGLYHINYNFIVSTTAAEKVIVSLNNGATTVNQSVTQTSQATQPAQAARLVDPSEFTGEIMGDTVIRSTGCGNNFTLINSSAVAITPVITGTESVRVTITKIA